MTDTMARQCLTTREVQQFIIKLWDIFSKTEDDERLRLAFLKDAENSVFWAMVKVIRHCDYYNWDIPTGLATDPQFYHECWKEFRLDKYAKAHME